MEHKPCMVLSIKTSVSLFFIFNVAKIAFLEIKTPDNKFFSSAFLESLHLDFGLDVLWTIFPGEAINFLCLAGEQNSCNATLTFILVAVCYC